MEAKFKNLNASDVNYLISKVSPQLKSKLEPAIGSEVCMRCEGLLDQAEECMNC